MKVKSCIVCGRDVDVNNGGCAMQITLCINHIVNMSNIALCSGCYAKVENDFQTLNQKANLGLVFDEGEVNDE